jgi:hypothetical protein
LSYSLTGEVVRPLGDLALYRRRNSMADPNTKATNDPQADPNPTRAPRPDANRTPPVDRSGTEATTGANLSPTDEPTDLAPDNDARRSAAIDARADRAADEDVDGADADRDALRQAEEDVYGDDNLRQRGSGSRYQRAHPSQRAHLAVAEQQTSINEVASLARQLSAAAERLAAANRDVMKATEEAKDAAPRPTG